MKWLRRNNWGRREIWERILFRLATWYDRIDPTVCWGHLALWAIGVMLFRSLSWPWHVDHDYWDQSCRAADTALPYCDKCGRTGWFWLGCSPEKRRQIESSPCWPPWGP